MRTVIEIFVLALALGCAPMSPPSDEEANVPVEGKADTDDYGWSHVRLHSVQGVDIAVDFVSTYHPDKSYKPCNTYRADPIWINVSGENLTGEEMVRVVFNFYELDSYPSTVPYQYVVDLAWEDYHFTGELANAKVTRSYLTFPDGYGIPMAIRYEGYAGTFTSVQTVAVVIDGEWQTDPVSESNDFTFRMWEAVSRY